MGIDMQERAQLILRVMQFHDLISKLPEGVTLATVALLQMKDAEARQTLSALHSASNAIAKEAAQIINKLGEGISEHD